MGGVAAAPGCSAGTWLQALIMCNIKSLLTQASAREQEAAFSKLLNLELMYVPDVTWKNI